MGFIKKIRILESIRQGQIGGGETHLLSLLRNLNKEEFEPTVLSFTDGPMVINLRQMGVETGVIYSEKPFDINTWPKVEKFIKNHKIDLVHAHGTRAMSNVFWAAKRSELPLAYSIHGWSFHDDQHPLIKRIRILAEKFLVNKSDVNISVSASNQKRGKKYLKHFESKIIGYGIDQNKFNPQGSFKNIRKELNIPQDSIVVLFIARFIHQKQPLRLISSFAKACKEIAKLRLLMVGDGDEKLKALKLVEQLNIKDKVIFQPFRNEVPDILAAADIFVLPSLWEGMSIGLLEAMAMAKAIIATNVDGTCELLQHQYNGILISTELLEQRLTNAILRLASDDNLRIQLGNRAHATLTEKYGASVMTRQIEDLYKSLLVKKPNQLFSYS